MVMVHELRGAASRPGTYDADLSRDLMRSTVAVTERALSVARACLDAAAVGGWRDPVRSAVAATVRALSVARACLNAAAAGVLLELGRFVRALR